MSAELTNCGPIRRRSWVFGHRSTRRQGALSWELRAATSLARLLRDQRRCDEAVAVIEPVYNRFTEGFGTTDLANAKALIDDLHRVSRDDKERLASVRRTSRRII